MPAGPGETQAEVVVVGQFLFPDGDAPGSYVLGLGRALRGAGFSVAFAGRERSGRPADLGADGVYRYDGFPYVPTGETGVDALSRAVRLGRMYLTAGPTMTRLAGLVSDRTRAVIVYNAPACLLLRLRPFCRARRVALVACCTEWYDPGHIFGGRLGPFAFDSALRMRWLQPRIGRVIAVSSFLADYYRRRGCEVVRVPPLVDTTGCPEADAPAGDVLKLVYAGDPGRKDLLGNVLRSLHALRGERPKVELHAVGPTREGLARCLGGDAGILDDLGDTVVCHGRVPRAEAQRLVRASDFSVLLRPDRRYAHAGFPTKVGESLSLGVPVLANVTSDIGEYVRDGKEGLLLPGCGLDDFAVGLRRALALGPADRAEMRRRARRRAGECFDYRNYVEPLGRFLREAAAAAGRPRPAEARARAGRLRDTAESPGYPGHE